MSVIKCNKNKDLGQNRAAKQQQQRKRGGGVGHWGDIRSTYMYKHTEVVFETDKTSLILTIYVSH